MALIGYANKLISDIKSVLLQNENIVKFLYYTDSDEDIQTLPPVKNPISTLKNKVFLNRRLEILQKDADVGMTINLYSKQQWKKYGTKSDTNLKNVIEVGIISHMNIDETLNGSRTNVLIEEVLATLRQDVVDGLGDIHFINMFMMKDLSIEYVGYLLYFEIFNIREEGLC
jgi:hypothetical protein